MAPSVSKHTPRCTSAYVYKETAAWICLCIWQCGFVCVLVYMFCMSVCLPARLSVYLPICLNWSGRQAAPQFAFFDGEAFSGDFGGKDAIV